MQKTLSLAFAAAACGVPPPSPSVAVLSQTNIDNTQLAFNWPKGIGIGLGLGLGQGRNSYPDPDPGPAATWRRLPHAACRLPLAVCSCLKSHINNENCTVAKSLNGKILQASTLLPLLLPCSNAVGGGTTLCCTAAHTSVCGKVIGLRALCA